MTAESDAPEPSPTSNDLKPAEASATPAVEGDTASPPEQGDVSSPDHEPAADSSAARPSQRIQIGSQRAEAGSETVKAKPVDPVSKSPAEPAPQKSHYPPPNIRDRLSPDLEKELEAALGGESLDQIIDGTEATSGENTELAPDTKVIGTVAKVHREDIFLELGGRNQGLLPLKQFEKSDPPEVGAQLEVLVSRFNAEEGYYEVSLPTASVDIGNWDEVQVGQVVDVAITGANKGGLECQVSGIRGFIPMGQISVFRVENPEEYVGQKLNCVITEANRDRKNLVLSHRALMERERKEQREKLLAEIKPGDLREGVVRSLQDFGAFVDLGGVDGLIHVSQLSWERVAHPKDVLQVGQNVKVRVEKVNQENGKISLGYRELGENPWDSAATKYAVGSRVTGKVTKLMQFGAFVKLEPGVEGLIHISEMGHGRVNRCSDVVSESQEVEVKVLTVDTDAQRIGLSLKALLPEPEKPAAPVLEEKTSDEPPRRRKKADKNLKGGIGGPSGGEQFGLKW
ncbi:MAG: S1 RNA-binding domain-containing protein [Planctomycetales bacterium]|nr:S1 RNA-binding domain-containing protein [Planctomycetales bacterium]